MDRDAFPEPPPQRVSDLAELTDAARRVAAGGLVVDRSVVAKLVGRTRARNPLDDLTDRERDVLAVMAVMAEGRSNQAICERMYRRVLAVLAYLRG